MVNQSEIHEKSSIVVSTRVKLNKVYQQVSAGEISSKEKNAQVVNCLTTEFKRVEKQTLKRIQSFQDTTVGETSQVVKRRKVSQHNENDEAYKFGRKLIMGAVSTLTGLKGLGFLNKKKSLESRDNDPGDHDI